jgi:hypothetical protein
MKIIKGILILLVLYQPVIALSQGLNNTWLLGYQDTATPPYSTMPKARINFMSGSDSVVLDTRKMRFINSQGNISDKNGNLLMSSNGIWIADATGDTMMNGAGLNPGAYATANQNSGMPHPNGNMFLPFPGDSNKYALFHISGGYGTTTGIQLFYSIIDITLNNGLGAVIIKNNLIPLGSLGFGGISACKHANGRDWWVVVENDSFNVIYKILFTSTGISTISSQSFAANYLGEYSTVIPTFSKDGKHFAYTTSPGMFFPNISYMRYFDFDRCSGNFTYVRGIQIPDSMYSMSVAFSANSKFLYFGSYQTIYQLNIDSVNTSYPIQTVAAYDGFLDSLGLGSPTFGVMYLASNNKIYLRNIGASRYLSIINYPDSAGLLCDVQQHAKLLHCLNITTPNHPNYFLGKMENSVCDTLLNLTPSFSIRDGVEVVLQVFPNPVNDVLSVSYTPSPQTQVLELLDVHGKVLLLQKLPPWSQTQTVDVSKLPAGLYQCRLLEGAVTCKFVKLPSRAGE